jgi:hypothetical protein
MIGTFGSEEKTWNKSKRGGYYTIFNVAPMLAEFTLWRGILRDARTKHYGFELVDAKDYCQLSGISLPATDATFFSVYHNNGQIVFEIDVNPSDEVQLPWKRKSRRKAYWVCEVIAATPINPFSKIRIAFTPEGKGFQSYARIHRNHWQPTTYDDAVNRLQLMGLSPPEIKRHLATDFPLKLVSKPFKGEFVSKYEWNMAILNMAKHFRPLRRRFQRCSRQSPVVPRIWDSHGKRLFNDLGSQLVSPAASTVGWRRLGVTRITELR